MNKIKNDVVLKVMGMNNSFKDKVTGKIKAVLFNKRGEGYVDSAIKIIIAIVVGGLLLAGLYGASAGGIC